MLRASNLGLRDHHDKSRFILWICHRRILPVLPIHLLVETGSSRAFIEPARKSEEVLRADSTAALANVTSGRVYGRFLCSATTSRGFSTFSSNQGVATYAAPAPADSSLHVPSVEQVACTRTTETDPLQDVHNVSRLASQRVNPSEKVLLASSNDTDSDAVATPPPLHDDNVETARFLNVLATTTSGLDAWDAYEHLGMLESYGHTVDIPLSHLRRLFRLLSQNKPRTRSLFLRLLSVLSTLHKRGSPTQVWQWNALIDCAGKGWRKTRPEDFKNALNVFEDMIAHRAPGAAFFGDEGAMYEPVMNPVSRENVVPDIVTYTTLINIAGRTMDERAVHHVMSLLNRSGLTPNRITYLSLIRYFTRLRQLSSVRETLYTMKHKGEELGLDGVNACIWAYGYNGRLDIASTIYRVLRHQYLPEDGVGAKAVANAIDRLSTSEGLDISPTLIPDAITYHILIQVYAYHGDFNRCIQTFIDMISFPDSVNIIANQAQATRPTEAGVGSPTLAAYRAIFLGFARHGQLSSRIDKRASSAVAQEPSPWNEANLYTLFHSFLGLPMDAQPSERTIYWLVMGFHSTIGQPTVPQHRAKLRRIWEHLETRFGGEWGGRLGRLRKEIYET